MSLSELRLAEMLCTRLCHDLTGPIGAVNNGAEFLQEEGFNMHSQAVELITTSAFSAVARLQFYRLAYGRVKEQGEASLADHQKMAEDFFNGTKITLDWTGGQADAAGISLSFRMMRLLFNFLIITGNALIKGGSITIKISKQGEDGKRIEVIAKGDAVKWEKETETVLSQGVDIAEVTPKTVQLYVTRRLCEELNAHFSCTSSEKELCLSALQQRREDSAAA